MPRPDDRRSSSLPAWAWVLIAFGSLPLLCCGGFFALGIITSVAVPSSARQGPVPRSTEPSLRERRANIPKWISLNMTRDDVELMIGKPDRQQTMRSAGMLTEFWYYGSTQVVFENDLVRAINSY
jgi:hypothetical protein